jgi:hypothetical protein
MEENKNDLKKKMDENKEEIQNSMSSMIFQDLDETLPKRYICNIPNHPQAGQRYSKNIVQH